MDLQDLYLNKDIDRFTLHVCKQNNLLDLESILEYYRIKNSFLGLDYCSKEDNQKLILLCTKYSSLSTFPEQITNPPQGISFKEKKHIPNYTLEQLEEIEDLGIRSQNACKYFNLDTMRDIIYYYKKNGDFLKVRNCGRKSNDELIEVCNKYEEFFIDDLITQIEEENKNPLVAKIEDLKVRQKKIVNNLIVSSFNDLSVRSSNALKNYLEGEINLKGFKSLFSEQNLKLTNLRNVGKKSIEEIQIFLNLIEEQIEIVSVFENEDELTIELFNSFLTRTFGVTPTILSKIGNAERKLEKIIAENGALEIQKEKLLKDNLRLNREYNILLQKSRGNQIIKTKISEAKKYADSLQMFIDAQKQNKKVSLADSLLSELKKLMHKMQNNDSSFIEDARIDILPDGKGLKVSILDSDGNEIPKESFSTGEKQIYISCLIKAILNESIQNFPIFIDTPLGRLDHEHIENILKNYYPNLSNQVVLLATNNEITPRRFNSINSKVAKSYLIVNENKKSNFKPGYFQSYENKN